MPAPLSNSRHGHIEAQAMMPVQPVAAIEHLPDGANSELRMHHMQPAAQVCHLRLSHVGCRIRDWCWAESPQQAGTSSATTRFLRELGIFGFTQSWASLQCRIAGSYDLLSM